MRIREWAVLGLLSACGRSAVAPATPVEAAPTEAAPAASAAAEPGAEAAETYPAPYTADQIRDATHPGRSYTWRVEVPGKPAIERVVIFQSVSAEGADLTRDGTPAHVTWEELHQHAEFPAPLVTTHDESVTVPAGSYDCTVYSVKDPTNGEISTFYFAKQMPGAPVLFYTEKAGTRVMTSTLIRYSPGS